MDLQPITSSAPSSSGAGLLGGNFQKESTSGESQLQSNDITLRSCYNNNKEKKDPPQYSENYTAFNYIYEMHKYIKNKRKLLFYLYFAGDTCCKSKKYQIENRANEAQVKKKVYCLFGYYPAVRYQFNIEGWVEKQDMFKTKYDVPRRKLYSMNQITSLDSAPLIMKHETANSTKSEYLERQYMAALLKTTEPDIVFSLRMKYIPWRSLSEHTIISFFPRCNFCTKVGLNQCLSHKSIFKCSNDSLRFPRGYNLCNKTCLRRFLQDFRETLCFSLMRFVVSVGKKQNIHSLDGTVPVSTFDFAEQVCKRKIQSLQLENVDVDRNTPDRYSMNDTKEETHHWREVEENIHNMINKSYLFEFIEDFDGVFQRAIHLTESFDQCQCNKQEICDGIYNIWVLKPVANCSGYGIRLFCRLQDSFVDRVIHPLPNKYIRCVVQKYIERPLLIYGVKFDLRVWYLVTTINQFKLWVYHEGYVRFCSKPHSNKILDETRHITNVRIQKKYRSKRNPSDLPPELMWDFKQLKKYFTDILDLPKTWDNIMKAMEDSILTTMQCAISFDHMSLRKNTFQLFGADFLINEDFRACLIEVNNGPGLSPTTSIIAKKTTHLLMDIVKVVTSEKDSPKNHTDLISHGNFHLIYSKEMASPVEIGPEKLKRINLGLIMTPLNVMEWRKYERLRKRSKTPSVKPKPTTTLKLTH